MTLKLSFVVLGLPSLIYYLVQVRRGRTRPDVLKTLGLCFAPWRYLVIGAAAGAAVPLIAATLSAAGLVTMDYTSSMSGLAGYRGYPRTLTLFIAILALEGIGTALGEELLFRGLLEGVFISRFGGVVGNTVQAILFGATHLVVIVSAPQLAVFAVIFAFMAGLFLGWLRLTTGSIAPSLVAHSIGFPVAVFVLL